MVQNINTLLCTQYIFLMERNLLKQSSIAHMKLLLSRLDIFPHIVGIQGIQVHTYYVIVSTVQYMVYILERSSFQQ